MEDIKVPKFVLENILNTLTVVKYFRRAKSETCLDRCIAKKNINQLNKLLTGEEITGLEGLNK